MRRAFALLLLFVAMAPGTWLRTNLPPQSRELSLRLVPLALPPRDRLRPHLGIFDLEGMWQLESPHEGFGGFSALVTDAQGALLAISDRGYLLRFSPPGADMAQPRFTRIMHDPLRSKHNNDAEAATADPATGTVWIAWEGRNAISRHRDGFPRERIIFPRALHDWSANAGPESLLRLRDGRFIALREGFTGVLEERRHRGIVFLTDPLIAGDPQTFDFSGPAQFSPTDMAQLPDGRVLILMRRPVWPLPARFAGRIVLADPREIAAGRAWSGRVIARLTSTLPVDNFEGIAVVPRGDGSLTVWLISDDNGAQFQRTLLWKLRLDPARLPRPSKKARD